ncbi:helicase-related protein [Hazenella coriacea]|uniref:Helicase-like protein n=1 Tax=Hazenella coriacea TaxID=1179467 RepID=A0A4R3LBU0_9BACL|nr:helicase-related protein [Hazenella coriacea]TCS95774.1 helicase-like protein [Hazenella coriacea]
MISTFSYDYGFVYEYGYNIGLFSSLVQLKSENIELNPSIKDRLTKWMELPDQCFSNFVISFRNKNNITDESAFEEIRRNIEHIFFFGYFSGQHAMRHYIQSIPLIRNLKTEVVYFQSNFIDPLNQDILQDKLREAVVHDINKAFNYDMEESMINYYQKKGKFLKADSIVLLKQGTRFFLLITDNSVFLHRLVGIDNPERLLKSLQKIRSEMGRKTKFSHLTMDTSGIENIQLHRLLLQYAHVVKDKTLLKIVQAGSYAYSFLDFMTKKAKIQTGNCEVSIMGKVDYDYSIVNFKIPLKGWTHTEEGVLLKRCHQEYKNLPLVTPNPEPNGIPQIKKDEIPPVAKEILLRNMIRNTNIDHESLKDFVKEVQGTFSISDHIEGFQNTAGKYGEGKTFRDDHARSVTDGLKEIERRILYLTGNPGIGKTTVIVDELKKHERFLFLYTSCRRTVNDDILLKFKEGDRLFVDDLIALSTSFTDEQVINAVPVNVVNYVMNDDKRLQPSRKLTYLPKNRDRHEEKGSHIFRDVGDNEFIEDFQSKTGGVLKRLCEGIQEQIENPNIRKVIGTFSIQALKRTKEKTTIQHLQKLFPFVRYLEEVDVVIDYNAFDQFVERYPICWIMIDEITGTDEGVHLYQSLKKWLFDNIYSKLDEKRREKWNVKLIVADASMTNETIVHRCLNKESRFDHSKIYITSENEGTMPIQTKEIPIPIKKGKVNGWLVNTNSYPAKKLSLLYHIHVQGIPLDEYLAGKQPGVERLNKERSLSEKQDNIILDRVFEHLTANKEKPEQEQVIVYVQNIKRIEELKNKFIERYSLLFGEEAVEYQHYMVITSQLTAKARERAIQATDQVRCVFMTSSASRGISFKKSTKILAVLQAFNIEREMMEQIQLYYRMRGDSDWDIKKDKSIEFFVIDSYVYQDSDEEYQKSKIVIHLLSFLTLARASLVSRIFGKVEIGNRSLSLVPLGGSGISPVKYSLIQDVSDCMKLIAKELASKERFELLRELREEFNSTFGNMIVQTNEQIFQKGYTAEKIYPKFLQHARLNLSQLINFQPFCPFLFANGLLIFHIQDLISEKIAFLVHNRKNSESLMIKIKQALKEDLTEDLRKKLNHIIELLEYERENHRRLSNTFVENSRDDKRYVAIPVLAFSMFEAFKEYKGQDTDETFLDALYGLTRAFTDVTSVTPITSDYKDIPFITFKSDALEESFDSRFQQNYLLTSTEINILNLLLLEKI